MIRLELDGWHTNINFSASHIIPSHEKCGRLHGHNYAIHARIEGEETPEGVVFDFLPLKKELRKIAAELDHRMLIAAGMEELSEEEGEVRIGMEGKKYVIPSEDAVILDINQVTTEELSVFVIELVLEDINFPDNINALEIGVDEARGQGAWTRREI